MSCVQTTQDNAYHSYHQDEQGSTAYITEQENEVENCYRYDTFGNLIEKKATIENRILYTGQQYDQETGQCYLRARYYNPVVGRFLQEDARRISRRAASGFASRLSLRAIYATIFRSEVP